MREVYDERGHHIVEGLSILRPERTLAPVLPGFTPDSVDDLKSSFSAGEQVRIEPRVALKCIWRVVACVSFGHVEFS